MLRIDRREGEGCKIEAGGVTLDCWIAEINWFDKTPPSTIVAFDIPEGVAVVRKESESRAVPAECDRRVLLYRERKEAIVAIVGDTTFRIWVTEVNYPERGGPWVRLVFDAPKEVRVLRDELVDRVEPE